MGDAAAQSFHRDAVIVLAVLHHCEHPSSVVHVPFCVSRNRDCGRRADRATRSIDIETCDNLGGFLFPRTHSEALRPHFQHSRHDHQHVTGLSLFLSSPCGVDVAPVQNDVSLPLRWLLSLPLPGQLPQCVWRRRRRRRPWRGLVGTMRIDGFHVLSRFLSRVCFSNAVNVMCMSLEIDLIVWWWNAGVCVYDFASAVCLLTF